MDKTRFGCFVILYILVLFSKLSKWHIIHHLYNLKSIVGTKKKIEIVLVGFDTLLLYFFNVLYPYKYMITSHAIILIWVVDKIQTNFFLLKERIKITFIMNSNSEKKYQKSPIFEADFYR